MIRKKIEKISLNEWLDARLHFQAH